MSLRSAPPPPDGADVPRPGRGRRTAFVAGALALGCALALAAHWPVLTGRVPFPAGVVLALRPWSPPPIEPGPAVRHGGLWDVALQMYPWRVFAQRTVREGELPLWNPHVLLGAPHLANAQSALFWPGHWLDVVLPLPVSWTLEILLEIALTFLATALLARELGCRPSGALLAGAAFSLSGFLVGWGPWPLADGARCLPLVLWAVLRLDRRPSAGTIALAAVALALPVLAGHPQTALYDGIAAAAFASTLALRRAGRARRDRGRRWGALVAAASIAAGLGAVQWLPTAEWIGQLVRPLDRVGWRSLPPEHLVSWVSRDLRANPNALGIEVPEEATYVGIVTLILAPFALVRRRRGVAGFWAALAGVAAALAYGVPPIADLWRSLPLLGGLPNHRLILWLELALALLAGLGLTALTEREAPPARRRLVLTAGLSLGGSLALLAWTTGRADAGALTGPTGLLTSWLVWSASALGCALLLRGRSSSLVVARCLLALLVCDLAHVASRRTPSVEPGRIYPPAPVFDFLRSHVERDAVAGRRFRVGFLTTAAAPNAGMVYGIDTAGGYDYVTRATAALLAPLTGGRGWSSYDRLRREAPAHGPLLDLLAVRYLVAATGSGLEARLAGEDERYRRLWRDGRLAVYENRGALPGAALVPWSGIRVEPDAEAARRALAAADFDPRRTALLAAPPAPPRREGRRQRGPTGALALRVEQLPGRYRVEVEAPTRSILVLSEMAYPGWDVTVDGAARPLLVVDTALQGVAVPRGAHQVEFTFDPPSVRWGLRISALSLAACLALAGLGRRRSRRSGTR